MANVGGILEEVSSSTTPEPAAEVDPPVKILSDAEAAAIEVEISVGVLGLVAYETVAKDARALTMELAGFHPRLTLAGSDVTLDMETSLSVTRCKLTGTET